MTRQAAGGRPRGTGTQIKAVNPGKAKLNAVADKKVGKSSVRIVNALYNGLIKKGNMTSAKLLFDLADGLINCEDPVVMSQLYSYALTLESELQVAADMKEEKDAGKEEEVSQQVSEAAELASATCGEAGGADAP